MMILKRLVAAFATAVALAIATVPASAQSIIEGIWETQAKSQVTIVPCEAGFCGLVTKIVVPPEIVAQYGGDLAALGDNFKDVLNKDPALRDRPIQNMQILYVQPSRNPAKFDGRVYNPEDGNIYSGYVEILDTNRLKLNGCVLFNLICQGQDWVRVIEEVEVDAASATATAQ